MRRGILKSFGYISAITAILLGTGCSNSRQLSSASGNREHHSRFMNNISLNGKSRKVKTDVAGKGGYPVSPAPVVRDEPSAGNNSFAIQIKYAAILGMAPAAISNLSLYSFIDEWYGVRYRLGGNDKTGIDCSAFVQRVYENVFGTNLVRTALEQFNNCHMVWNEDQIREGDLVFFYSYTYSRARRHHHPHIIGKHISHVGIYLANNYFVHASSSNGVTISNLKEEYWSAKFAGAGEIPRG